MKTIAPLFVFLFSLHISFATVRNVPGSYPNISSALNACQSTDTVLVQPGTYTEQITWPNVADIKLLSAGDSSNTIISAGQNGRVISMNSASITNATLIRGFTIRDGLVLSSGSQGAGIRLNNSSPTLDALLIEQNRLSSDNWNYGAGIYISGGSPQILNCAIRNNFIDSATWGHGGGMYIVSGANVQISNCSIDHNQTTSSSWCYGVGIYVDASNATIVQSKIFENRSSDDAGYYYGGGIYAEDAGLNLNNVLIASNVIGSSGNFYRGGGLYLRGAPSVANLKHVTLAENNGVGNIAITGSGIYVDSGNLLLENSISYNPNSSTEIGNSSGTITISYSDIRGGFAGAGNINALPQFSSSSDFHLAPGSPCFGAGNPVLILNQDLDGQPRPQPLASNPDMGCYEADQTVVGQMDLQPLENITIAPNPANDFIRITSTNEFHLNQQVIIYDSFGKVISMNQLNAPITEINCTEWSSGIYFISINNQFQRLIKN